MKVGDYCAEKMCCISSLDTVDNGYHGHCLLWLRNVPFLSSCGHFYGISSTLCRPTDLCQVFKKQEFLSRDFCIFNFRLDQQAWKAYKEETQREKMGKIWKWQS